MNFVIPKKKRVLEKPEIDISSLEPKATIEDAPRDSPKFNTVKNIVLESMSDRQVNQFMQVEKVQLIKNQFLEYKYSQFKVNLRSSGQSDAESYGFVLIGFDDEDCNHIADNGYSVGTSFYGDLGLSPRGVYVYRHVDLTTPSPFYKDEGMRVMVFRTLRGKSYAVGLGSTELEPTLDCSSHIAASDHIPNAKKNRQQLYRQAAVYHYEYNKDMTLSEVPSGVLPYAVVDIRFSVSDRNQHSNLLPTYVSDQLYFYSVYEGPLTICSATFGKATLNTIFEESNKPHGLDESLIFTKFLKWADAYDVRGVAQLMAPETWGLVMKHREVCVKNNNERFEKWKVRFVSHFVWTCNEPRFGTIVNAMRVEQCAAIAYSIDATTYVAFPSSQFSSVFGLPWLQMPSLHVLVIHANPLFYADSTDVNCSNEETEIISKIPLGTAILDGDDATVCSSFESQVQAKAPAFAQPDMRGNASRSSQDEPLPQSSEKFGKPSDSPQSPQAEAESEPAAPLPPVRLPPFAGKSCLRNKPPQVFVEQPPLIGKSVPPPAPGVARSIVPGVISSRKTRIRWSDSVVDNENKCGKKLSNDRDEALKAGLHGRALPPKDLLTSKPAANTTSRGSIPARSPNHDTSSSPPVVVSKNKDLFQGVFNTIKKGNSTDVEAGGKSLSNVPLSERTETSRGYSMTRRLGQAKNCIITSLPLPLLSRNLDSTNRDLNMSSPVASATAQSSEDELMICDMEIESGSEETPTPPNVKPSPDGVDETADIIDDHDEDYDAQFMCETTSSMDSQSSSPPAPTTIPLDKADDEATAATSNSKIVGEKRALNGNSTASLETALPSTSENKDPINGTSTTESEAPASPPPPSVSAMSENVIRLLELLRANQSRSQPKPQCQDTDLRRLPSTASKDSAPAADDNHRTRKSRFDQPPPELADAGFLPKPVPTASVGFVGNVPALGSSVMDTDLRSTPPATLAFSIKKTATAPALNPPAPLVFGDDEDDEDESEDVRSRQRSERKDRDDRKDRDERVKRWGKAESTPPCDNTRPTSIPTSAPPAISPNIAGVQKEKTADNSKLFHILSGARLLQSQRDKKVAEQEPPSTHALPVSQSELSSEVTMAPKPEALTTTSSAGHSFASSCAPNRSTPAVPAQHSVLGTAFGLSQDVIQQLLKKSAPPRAVPEQSVREVTPTPDAPASPDPEGPASPDAPASPDPDERDANGSGDRLKAHSEIPLDCWQPSEDKRREPERVITVRSPKKPKRPKDHDGVVSCGGSEQVAMNSWIKAVEQKSDASSSSRRGKSAGSSRTASGDDDEEEEGEIRSDDEVQATAQPIRVIGAPSQNIHAAFAKQSEKTARPEIARPPPLASVINPNEPPPLMGVGRGFFPDQPFGHVGQRRGFPPPAHSNPFGGPQWPPYAPVPHSMQGGSFQPGPLRQAAPEITVIVPDFMMFNRATMTIMDPAGFESFCERLKAIQTQENRIVSLQIHERLLHYVREMMQSLSGSEIGNAFQMYYSVILKYKEQGIVHFMERHLCDDSDVCTAQTISCFTALRKSYYQSTVLIYMSNMSPSSSTGSALSAMGVLVLPPSAVMRSFGLDPARHPFQS